MKKVHVHKKAQLTGHNASIYALAFGKREGTFLSAGGDGWVVEWDIEEPELGKVIAKTDAKIFSLNHFPDKKLMAAGNMEGGIHWISTEKNIDIKNIAHHEQGIFSILPLGNNAITGGGLGKLTKWNLENIATQETLHLSNTSLRCMDINDDSIIVGSSDCSIYVLGHDLDIRYRIEAAHENSVFSIAFHPNEEYMLSGGRDAILKVWDLKGNEVNAQSAHWFTINDIKFRPDSTIFATASRDKTIRLWDAENFTLIKEINAIKNGGHVNSVNRLMWLDNHHLISASDDRTIIIWEVV